MRPTSRLLQSILEVFGGGVVAVLGKGSCFKGDFLPGYSDFDLHGFLDPARAPMLGPRAPALDRAVAFQRAIGPIRAEDYGVGALQISFVDAVDYAQAQAFFPWLRRDLRAQLHQVADKPDTRLAGAVRLFGTSVKPAVSHAAVLLGEPPLEVWARPLGNVLPIVEPAWCPSRGLGRFFGDALRWAEVRSDPERLRAMFAAGWHALDELCAAAAAEQPSPGGVPMATVPDAAPAAGGPGTAGGPAAARAARLHKEAIVIDTLGGGPNVLTPRMQAAVAAGLAAGKSGIAILSELDAILLEDLAADAAVRAEYLDRWRQAGVTVSSVTQGGFGDPPFSFRSGLEGIAATHRLLSLFPDDLVLVTRADDVRRARREGKLGILMNLQNTTHFDGDLKHIDLFYNLGVRVVQLTYNSRNLVGDGCTERTNAGLSHFGVELVRRLNRRGMLIDLSHCGEQTAWDAMEVSDAPVAFTHTFCRALSRHDRGKTDAQLRAVAQQGGYIGILCVPFFLSGRPASVETWANHVDHAVRLCGIDHVGIGTDWGAVIPPDLAARLNEEMAGVGFRPEHRVDWNARLAGYDAWEDWPNLTAALVRRGYADEDIKKLLGGNFLRIFERVVG